MGSEGLKSGSFKDVPGDFRGRFEEVSRDSKGF